MTKNYFSTIASKMCVLVLPAFLAVGCLDGGKGAVSGQRNPNGFGPAPVSLASDGAMSISPSDLGSAGNYVIMAKAGIDDTSGSRIVGNMAVSPIAATAITDFGLVMDTSGQFSGSASVVGKIYASTYAPPTPSNLTTAIGSMETAYADAAGRVDPDFTELGAGEIGGLTLTPGLYKWGTQVNISTTVYISGSPTDVWIFQIAQDLVMANGMSIILLGGAKPENIYWQVTQAAVIGTTAHFEGIILAGTAVTMQTNSTMNGRIYAQTAVTLDSSDVTQP